MPEGTAGTQTIERLKKGDDGRTALHASVINEIIDRVNALSNMTLTKSGTGEGKVLSSDSNTVLDLGDVGSIPDPETNATYVWSVTNFVQSWKETEECACGVVVDGGGPS